jgi:hypothetical protein
MAFEPTTTDDPRASESAHEAALIGSSPVRAFQRFVEGAEERSLQERGRRLSRDELARVLGRFAGDLRSEPPAAEAYDPTMDLKCPDCGAIAWEGRGARVDGAGTADVVVESDDWQPGQEWRCRQCKHVVANPSPKQQALDEAVGAWLEAQHV